MTAARTALVVGGGTAGMTAAIMLTRAGVAVRIVDIDPNWRVYGAGITITAATLRAFKRVGILERVMDEGHTHAGVQACDVQGRPIEFVRSPVLEPGLPGAGGILRPVLHRILSDLVKSLGIPVSLGLTVDALVDRPDGLEVTFSDGTTGRYDMAIGADGIYSKMRTLLFPDAPGPKFTGQACWRLITARPPAIDTRHFFLGGPVKVGLTPVSREEMYLFLLEHVPDNPWRDEPSLPGLLAQLLEPFGGPLADIRRTLGPGARIVYRPLEGGLLRRDWFSGRAILMGDAAHASTPQLASGAGMGCEDGIVIAEEVARASTVEEAFRGFMRRRYERCRTVVENSLEIGRLEVAKAPPAEQTAILARSLQVLAAPI
jgi:2-polyprenyl-6-methoxyphenol hydroxylase-like FAD-dependent oxidoreductase